MEIVAIDFTILEPASDGGENVLAAMDVFIKALGTVPERLHADQGRNFESEVIAESCKLYGVKKADTTPHHL